MLDLDKKKYTQKEVSLIFDAYKKEYEKRFFELRARVNELVNENERLKIKLDKSSDKETLVLAVLTRAEKTAQELEKQSMLEYELELERLKSFVEKWEHFFSEENQSNLDSPSQKLEILKDQVKSANKSSSPKQVIRELDKILNEDVKENPIFNPKKKIGDYIAATNQGGFNMDEVMNPGELKLEDICKELGLID